MSDDHEQSAPDVIPEANPTSGDSETSAAPRPRNPYPPGSPEFIAELKRDVDKTRLPPDLREEILANQPPLEELERGYRELIENGGISSEEFWASLGLGVEPQP